MSEAYSYQEKEWIVQLVAGNEQAFHKIYENIQGRIFLFAFKLTKSKMVAEEIVQDVFVRLWEKREQIDIEKNFNAYVLQIAKNLIINRFKKTAQNAKLKQKLLENMQALKNGTTDQLIEKELDRLHRQAINRLSPQKKVIYLLSREEELTYDQIAEKLNLSKNTVRNQIADALKSIREYLTTHPELGCLILAIIFYKRQ